MLQFEPPKMEFTSSEIIHLRNLWSSLRLFKTETVKADHINTHNRPVLNCKRTRSTTSIDDVKVDGFIQIWSAYLVDLEVSTFCGNKTLALMDIANSDTNKYQLLSMFKLLTYMLDNLMLPSMSSMDAVVQVSKVNARIWNLETSAYNLIGEALVATILDILGRQVFTPELEITWLRFYCTVASNLVFHASDPASPLLSDDASVHSHKPSLSEQSTLASRLSLLRSRDDTSSILSLEVNSSVHIAQDTVSVSTAIDEDSEEDNSYDLINAFSQVTIKEKKPKRFARKKKSKYAPEQGSNPSLIGRTTSRQSEDCTIT